MGPVGVGVAVLEAAVVVETEVKVPLRPIETILAELEPVAVAAIDVEVPLVEYMLRRFGPPQYSMGFPEHVIEHWVLAGVLPATSTEPALITFPQ